MLGLVVFLTGVVLLFKGSFTLFGRTVGKPQARLIALALMAPLAIEFCAAMMFMPSYMQVVSDGSISINPDSLTSLGNTLAGIEIIGVLVSVGFALYLIFGSPQATSTTQSVSPPPQPSAIPAHVPDIMTVAEAAAYMRISETEVINLIDEGKLGAARIGDTYRIARIAIDDFMGTSQ